MKKIRKSHAIGMILGIILLLCCIIIANLGNMGHDNGKPAKYIFLFIGDGMGASHVAATESYLSYLEGGHGFKQVSFTKFPILGMTTTFSADKNVTCSSAAGTAIATGEKTINGRLGISPDGDTLKSVASILKEKGYKVAIMSSVPVNHATPASFYGHNTSRYDYYGITKEIPVSGFDLYAGSGFLDYDNKGKSINSKDYLQKRGYTVCFGEEEFDSATSSGAEKIVVCQESGREKSVSDYFVGKTPETDMTSDEMLRKSIEFLGEKSPFFIMYEQGEIDWAAHANKTMPMIESVQRLDEAVKVAIDFYNRHPDETLIVVTADHETGGIALGATETWGEVNLGWKVLDSLNKTGVFYSETDSDWNRKENDQAYIGWTTHGHTGSPVPVYAIGKGAERFSGRYDNTDIKGKLLAE